MKTAARQAGKQEKRKEEEGGRKKEGKVGSQKSELQTLVYTSY